MLFKSIEEISVWQESVELVMIIYKLVNNNNKLLKDFGLRDQIQRSAVSIPSNIAEGFERDTKQEFIRFLFISKGSSGELRTQIYIILKLEYISRDDFILIDTKCRRISGMLMNLIKSLKR